MTRIEQETTGMEKAQERKADKLLLSFLQRLIKLKPEESAGIFTLLGVRIEVGGENDKEVAKGLEGEVDTDRLLQDVCHAFDGLTTKRKKEIIKLMKQTGR